ncbi:MAG: hypothetical protein WBE78_05050 [Candidatus Binataceae bacterium]
MRIVKCGVRIPREAVERAVLLDRAERSLKPEGKSAVIQGDDVRKYTAAKLMRRINSGNRHPETDWGEETGKEIW